MPLFAALDRLKADLDILRPLAPEQEQRVLQKFRLEWNYNSNAIEGNSLTLGETRSLLLHGLTAAGKPMRDHLDIKGHNEAVLWLEDFVRDARPLTEQFIRGMHEVLLGEAYYTPAQTATGQPTRKMIVPGQYKTSTNNVLTATGEMFYFASPEETPARMTDLVDWYRQEDAAPTVHPVALAAEFHYRFVRIHPFDDGNGRMSRLLMNLILLRHGYPMTVIKATDRNPYLATLSEADAGDPEPFLRFIIDNVEAGLRLMIRAAQGESIDEPDDLDKKLALLKKQVLNREGTLEKMWTNETQAEIAHSILEPWLNDLSNQLARFNPFFLGRKLTATLFWQGPSEANVIALANLNTAGEVVRDNLKEVSGFCTQIAILIHWETFRNFLTPFDANAEITFNFKSFEFDIQHEIGSGDISEFEKASGFDRATVYSTPYRHKYDTDFIERINYKLANAFYYLIEKELKKEDEIAAKKSSYNEDDRDLPF